MLPVEADVVGKGGGCAVVGGAVWIVAAQGQGKMRALAALYNYGFAAQAGFVEFAGDIRRIIAERG
jgi:hypothetical protein